MNALICVALLSTGLAEAEPSSTAELIEGVRNRIKACPAIQVDLHVQATFWAAPAIKGQEDSVGAKPGKQSPVAIDSREIFRIKPSPVPHGRPWRYWSRTITLNEKPVVLNQVSFDEQRMRTLIHRSLNSSYEKYNQATITPFERPQFYSDNVFDQQLNSDCAGITEFKDHDFTLSRQIKVDWEPAPATELQGHPVQHLIGTSAYGKTFVGVIGHPHYLVVQRRYVALPPNSDQEYSHWKVTRVRDYDGLLYPESGTFEQAEIENQPRIEYKFEVTQIAPLADTATTSWHDDWPTGTVVVDQIQRKNSMVPFTPEEERAMNGNQLAQAPIPTARSSMNLWVVLAINVGLVLLIALFWIVRRRPTPDTPASPAAKV